MKTVIGWMSKITVVLLLLTSPVIAQETIDFDRDILPILSDRCYLCHGPDRSNRKAALRLDIESDAKEKVIVPGNPDQSELVRRIASHDPDVRMPPRDSKLAVKTSEIELIRRWITEGAKWEKHWAFKPATKVTLPTVQDSEWCHNELDFFIRRRLDALDLRPSHPASPERLIRRLCFDLTGLPPTLPEIDAFARDPNPDSYEQLIDRLLRSPAFGERMAADWLDAARYSDTYGYQVDRDRFVWPWRDWVVRSFNSNLSYDKFITQQLAGDLLQDATNDQILATTFNRLHPQKVEGGSVPEEFRIEYVADRTQTFATVFLGLTMECCRCHDHKYDPLTQKEYYQISAFFDKIDEAGLYSYFTSSVPTPTLTLATDKAKSEVSLLRSKVDSLEKKIEVQFSTKRSAFLKWLQANPSRETLIVGPIAHLGFETGTFGKNQSIDGVRGKAVRLTGDDGVAVKVGNFRRSDPFSISFWMNTPDVKERAVVFHRSRAWTDAGSRGYQLLVEDGRLSASLIHFWPGNAIRIRTRHELTIDQWHHVCMTWDGSSRARGLRIFVDGKLVVCDVIRDNLSKNITGGGGDTITIGERFRDRGFTNGKIDEFRVFDRELTKLEVGHEHDGQSLTTAITQGVKLSELEPDLSEQTQLLYDFYVRSIDSQFQSMKTSLGAERLALNTAVDQIPEIMVMKDREAGRATYFLNRGAYDARGEEVFAGTPSSLPAFPTGLPRNRLGLAKWLADPDHPLTSRVAVNRVWQVIFGDGLVRTPEDFGRQGQRPTHPELLDWLARDFVENGWDTKRLIKQIVMSSTYRQSAHCSAEARTKDRRNELLSRSPVHRLPAEMLRDNALAVSGLLVPSQGGPPRKPYEVEASFKPSKRDKGEGLYRRSLYTYWKRTGPAPVMMTLDAAKRDVCRVRRERTATPLEAFVLMNGPQFVEAARVLSERLLTQHQGNTDNVLTDIFRNLTSRHPSQNELSVIRKLYTQQLEYFSADSGRTKSYLDIGDQRSDPSVSATKLAALTSVGNALFSFDEALNRR